MLAELARLPLGCGAKTLARRLGVSRGTAQNRIDRLMRDGVLLVPDALAGERVLSMNDADAMMGQDAEAQYRDEIRRKAAEYGVRTTFRPFGDIERDVLARDGELAPEDRSDYEYSEAIAYALEPLDDIDPQDARELSEAEQMRALGFTEDEINEAIDGVNSSKGVI